MSMRRGATGTPEPRRRTLSRDETGKGTIRTFVALALVVAGVYAGVKLIPVRTAAYQFDDAVYDEVVFAGGRRSTDEAIKRTLVERAQLLGLPVEAGNITITRAGTKYISVDVRYAVPVEFIGGYTFDWEFSPHHQGPLIY